MKKNLIIGTVLVILLFLLAFSLSFLEKKANLQRGGYVTGSGTTELVNASGSAF